MKELALQPTAEPSIASMMQKVIDGGVTSENVAALGKLVDLYERMREKNAEQEFAKAFVALQAEMPKVKATEPVPNNDGTTRYRFAPYEKIMGQVQPMLTKHGFTVTFDTEYLEGGRTVAVCTLTHTGGHSRTNRFAARIGSGPPKATETQADASAHTYCKRFALCDALNITIERLDDDARAEGDVITPEQAADLQRRVKETKADRDKFLRFAGAASFEEIRATRLDSLNEMLRRGEEKQKDAPKMDAEGNYVF